MLECKAAVLRSTGADMPYAESRPLSIETVTLDDPKEGEVLVRVHTAGLCHSDLSNINGRRPPFLPMVLGHEGAGEIVATGPNMRDVSVGDHVVFQFAASCGRCANCLSGRPQICSVATAATRKGELMGGGTRIRDKSGQSVFHQSGISCFAEYAVVDRGSIVVIDPEFPFEKAALFGCAVMTGVGAVVNSAAITAGQNVAIVGMGGVGTCALFGARLAGASSIIAIDRDPAKLPRAREFGATHTFVADDPELRNAVRDLTHGGVDVALEFAGAVPALQLAFDLTRAGGTVVAAGLPGPEAQVALPQAALVRDEVIVRGSFMGSCVPVRDVTRFIQLEQQGLLPVGELVDRVMGFDGLNEGFDLLARGEALRQIVIPSLTGTVRPGSE